MSPMNEVRNKQGEKYESFKHCPPCFFFFLSVFFFLYLGWWKCQQTLLPKPLPVSQAFPGSQDLVLWCGAFPLLHTYEEWWERLSSCGLFLQGMDYRVILWETTDYDASFFLNDYRKTSAQYVCFSSMEIGLDDLKHFSNNFGFAEHLWVAK